MRGSKAMPDGITTASAQGLCQLGISFSDQHVALTNPPAACV
jgi:hypothetical protein